MFNGPYKKLDKLNDNFRNKVRLFISKVNEKKEIIFITESRRSQSRQDYLIKKGLSKIKRSKHQDGLAIDIAFRGDELYPKSLYTWYKVRDIAKKYGIDWGYDLWNWDKPHFQCNGKKYIGPVPLTGKVYVLLLKVCKFFYDKIDSPDIKNRLHEIAEIIRNGK